MNDRVASGSLRTVETLNEYRGYLKLMAVVTLGSRLQAKVDASDIVQQTMLDACRDFPKYRGRDEAQFKAWLREILANNLKSEFRHWKAQRRNPNREISLAQQVEHSSHGIDNLLSADQTSPSQQAMRNELYEQLAEALIQLPERQRIAVILKHFEGWSLADIAIELDKSTEAIGGLLRRGLKNLRPLISLEDSA